MRAAGATRGKPRMAAQLRPEEAPASKLSRRTPAGDRAVPTESGAGRASQVVKSTDAESVRVEAATTMTEGVEGVGTRLAGSDRERPMGEATSASASSPGPDAAGSSGGVAPAEAAAASLSTTAAAFAWLPVAATLGAAAMVASAAASAVARAATLGAELLGAAPHEAPQGAAREQELGTGPAGTESENLQGGGRGPKEGDAA